MGIVPALLIALGAAGCGGSAPGPHGTSATTPPTRTGAGSALAGAASPGTPQAAVWRPFRHVRGIVDLASPSPAGTIVVAARGRLFTLSPAHGLRPFAPRYAAPPGLEPYIVRSPGLRVAGAGCAFPAGTTYALRLSGGDGVTAVSPGGTVRKFAVLPRRGLENGIAFDETGRFGHRLLVTTKVGQQTVVSAIDCRGRVQTLTRGAPRVEGGIAVAPAGFGRFGGDLIAPDELSGNIYAIASSGRATRLVASGLPHGQDVGVESEGFVPRVFRSALVADRGTARNRHPGDNEILRIPAPALTRAGVRAGDLLVVGEGGAETIDVRCHAACRVRVVAHGPTVAHIEGHVIFSRAF